MGTIKQRRLLVRLGGFALLLLLASGCAPRESMLYLQPGRQLQAAPADEVRPLVRLDLYSEERTGEEGVIGGHFLRSERRLLKVEEGEAARVLRRMISRQLTDRNIPHVHGRMPVELERGEPVSAAAAVAPLVIDGTISRLWLEVKSGVLHSNYKIEIELTSRLHLAAEKKMISRVVHISEEMIKLSARPEEMEGFLDNSLEEAARQIVLKIVEQVGTGPMGNYSDFPGSWQQ